MTKANTAPTKKKRNLAPNDCHLCSAGSASLNVQSARSRHGDAIYPRANNVALYKMCPYRNASVTTRAKMFLIVVYTYSCHVWPRRFVSDSGRLRAGRPAIPSRAWPKKGEHTETRAPPSGLKPSLYSASAACIAIFAPRNKRAIRSRGAVVGPWWAHACAVHAPRGSFSPARCHRGAFPAYAALRHMDARARAACVYNGWS